MHLSVLLTGPASGGDEVLKRSLGLLPATGLQAAIGVDEQQLGRDERQELGNTVLDLLLARDTGRVDIVDTRPDLVGVAELLEGREQLEVGLGRLDGDNVRIKTLDRGEDVVEVGVAEVRVGLGRVSDTGGGELEGVDSPGEVAVPVNATERKLR
jgi:hypothetical protein